MESVNPFSQKAHTIATWKCWREKRSGLIFGLNNLRFLHKDEQVGKRREKKTKKRDRRKRELLKRRNLKLFDVLPLIHAFPVPIRPCAGRSTSKIPQK